MATTAVSVQRSRYIGTSRPLTSQDEVHQPFGRFISSSTGDLLGVGPIPIMAIRILPANSQLQEGRCPLPDSCSAQSDTFVSIATHAQQCNFYDPMGPNTQQFPGQEHASNVRNSRTANHWECIARRGRFQYGLRGITQQMPMHCSIPGIFMFIGGFHICAIENLAKTANLDVKYEKLRWQLHDFSPQIVEP